MATMTSKPLVAHKIVHPVAGVCWPVEAALYEYVMAGNGLFLRARKPGLEVCFSIAETEVRGLPTSESRFECDYPLVPADLVERILIRSQIEAEQGLEILFHLLWEEGRWSLVVPPQEQGGGHCKPLSSGPDSSHARALIEIHSHHSMRARFSSTDDRDEQGFRLYGVIGRVMTRPEIRMRVGCYGYFWEIDPSWVFEIPDGLRRADEEVL
ncbi:MAG: Mov34/MPN/PAD-1 family protein [Blastocatellia bacterium]|nr:Mov34/MPN/PAD-1 family protein [Blastocatellia bacterium]